MNMNIEVKNELRPCLVTIRKIDRKSGLKLKDKVVPGMFHGIWQHAHTFDPVLIGQVGGQISNPVAVVEINGKLQTADVRDIEFTDVVYEDFGHTTKDD